MDEKTIARFWSKVGGPGCWEWSGTVHKGGYGAFACDRKNKKAHRCVWENVFGPIPAGAEVCHRCDNPLCVRPDHLFLGSHADNMRDMATKWRSGANPGEMNGRARLTAEDVVFIRREKNRVLGRVLAERFGVSRSAIHMIWRGVNWRHLL